MAHHIRERIQLFVLKKKTYKINYKRYYFVTSRLLSLIKAVVVVNILERSKGFLHTLCVWCTRLPNIPNATRILDYFQLTALQAIVLFRLTFRRAQYAFILFNVFEVNYKRWIRNSGDWYIFICRQLCNAILCWVRVWLTSFVTKYVNNKSRWDRTYCVLQLQMDLSLTNPWCFSNAFQ